METTAAQSPKVFRDPVHNLISIDGRDRDVLLSLIETTEFQRLRRIRQLGLSAFTFHGAEHSRFAHSLGTYYVAKRMLESLGARRAEFRRLYRPLEDRRQEILTAALLHDIGHAPFSHVLERALVPREPSAGYPKDHEGWTQRLIRDRIANSGLGDVDWGFVLGLYDKSTPVNSAAQEIISSQLDADRLDYLLRDARAAGVPYAAQLDLEWLLNQIRIGVVSTAGVQRGVSRLCFLTPKARSVIEQYVLARQSMYVQVYMHKTTRAYEALLRHIFGLAEYIATGGPGLPTGSPSVLVKAICREELTPEEYLDLDDYMVWTALKAWARHGGSDDEGIRMLARKADMLVNRRRPYRTIELESPEHGDEAVAVETLLRSSGGLGRFSFHRDVFTDAPYRDIYYALGKDEEEQRIRPIYLLDSSGRTHLAEEASDILRRLADTKMGFQRLHYDDMDEEVMVLLRNRGLIKEAGR